MFITNPEIIPSVANISNKEVLINIYPNITPAEGTFEPVVAVIFNVVFTLFKVSEIVYAVKKNVSIYLNSKIYRS